MAKEKTRNVYRRLIVWMILFLLLAALAAAGYVYTKKQLADSEAKNAQEIERINAERVAQYNAAVAELSSQKVEVVNDQWPTPAAAGWDVIDLSTFPVGSGSQRNVTRKEMLTSGLLVINRWNAMPADLTDDMMISISNHSRADKDKENNIPTSNSSVMLQTVAVEALMELYKDARVEGLDMDNIIVEEGYRSMEVQSKLWSDELNKLSSRYSGDRLTEEVRKSTAYPGTSDFHTGLSFKVYNWKKGDNAFSSTPLHETEQGKWIYQNAWKYGYIFRFPVQGFPYADTEDKSFKTGISLSMKVYRYVGKGNAAAMNTLDMCLEEYVEYLMQHPHIAIYENGTLRYEIYRQDGGYADTTVTVPFNAKGFTASTDNVGGLVTVIEY